MNVGDRVNPSLLIDPFDGTTVASLIVTKPDGTTVAGTGEATSGGGAWTADEVTLDQAGLWLLTWTVAGVGAGVEAQRLIVAATATPIPAETPLATISDLVYRLGRELTATEAAKAPGMLADASSLIRSRCRRSFTEVTDQELVLRPVGSFLRLPNTPVTEVAQVEQIGTAGTADRVMSASEWAFDGIDQIELWPNPSLVTGVAGTGTYADTYRVQWSSGGAVHAEIVRICCGIVLRSLLAPTEMSGIQSETIGSYSYRLEDGSPGVAVTMTDIDERALARAGFLRRAGTIQTRAA